MRHQILLRGHIPTEWTLFCVLQSPRNPHLLLCKLRFLRSGLAQLTTARDGSERSLPYKSDLATSAALIMLPVHFRLSSKFWLLAVLRHPHSTVGKNDGLLKGHQSTKIIAVMLYDVCHLHVCHVHLHCQQQELHGIYESSVRNQDHVPSLHQRPYML